MEMRKATQTFLKNKRGKREKDFPQIDLSEGLKSIYVGNGKYMIVDEEDFEKLSQNSWSSYNYRGVWRCQSVINKKTVKPHRIIMGVTDPKIQIDHIDGNPFNNSKRNLRLCSNAENNMNIPPRPNGTSKYKGVRVSSNGSKYLASIMSNYKGIHIGTFKSEEDAARAYDAKARELFGEFAYLNFPE